jgi:hypothetical protein
MAYPVLHVIECVVALRLVALLLKRLPLGEQPVLLIMHGVSLGRGFVRSLFPLFECVLGLSKHRRRVLLRGPALCSLPRCHTSRVSFV